ncbi:MAG TPA: DEAD/DEAH box helicase [Verrucomicrobiae bacterium]|nr:DEAD/DEAH box helicase [Verrucomicrobiae bacterium]
MISYTELVQFLRGNGYTEAQNIHVPGDFVVQGDLITCWPITSTVPYRLHFFGEELEKLEKQAGEGWEGADDLPDLLANHLATDYGTVHPGEYVVHPVHGVGIFMGLVTETTLDGDERQFVALEYAGNDRLLVPFERMDGLMPYIGRRHPRLTRLYSKSWLATKERVKKDLIGVARGLLKIYAGRQLADRAAYPRAQEWLDVLAESAGFELTEDQQRSLGEILHDLEHGKHPMDRLLCGDVGFGKTEVALRAAAEVLAAGKQVAFVAPTTILVEQHHRLLEERFAYMPVRIGKMSRLSLGRDASLAERLKEGGVDLVVGTHRLLGKNIAFKDLGLLIVDEEQKFGVAQKETLKKLRPHLDVLSLSATPIPRTLSMSLSGLRGLSILRTPPKGRMAIETEVEGYSDDSFRQALLAELERGGQMYVVHNRVQTLAAVEERIRHLLKDTEFADVAMATVHGQMDKNHLSERMGLFLDGKLSILVASSIVEHGLDCPNANTLIVLHSERFGLSDLYQLRGRVGRRQKQAYALFFTGGIEHDIYENKEEIAVTVAAKQRLSALKEADVLGSGWSIALRDLEIRGGGNILGNEQHGSMEAIGLLLYSQLLQEEIGRQAHQLGIQLFQSADV